MKKFSITILLLLAVAGMKAQTGIKFADLDWVLGKWMLDAGEIKVYETWKKGEGNSYIAEGYVLQGKDTIVTEVLKIEKIGPHWVYIAQINDNNPVMFTLKAGSKAKELTFENLEHDNPQRIVYKFVNKDEIYARTEAVVDGNEVVEEYPYMRRK